MGNRLISLDTTKPQGSQFPTPVNTEVAAIITGEYDAAISESVAAATATQVPAAAALAAPAAVDADLASRNIGFVDEGGGEGHFTVGGASVSGTLVPPAATVSGIGGSGTTGRAVLSSEDGATARASIGIPSAMAIIDRKTPAALPEVYSVFATKSDGPAPATFDSGQQVLGSSGPGTNPQAIVLNGLLTSQPTNHGPAAFYYLGQCAGDVTRIGARFRMHPNEIDPESTTFNGNACLAILHSNDWSGGGPPTMSLHYVIKQDSWSIGVWDGYDGGGTGDHGFKVLGAQNIYPPLKLDGTTEYEVEAWLDGDTCTFTTPDGGRFTLTDSRFATFTGSHFFFEYQAPVADTDNRVSYTHIWASSGKQYVPNQETPRWLRARKATEASTVTTTTSFAPFNVPGIAAASPDDYVTVPPSGAILVNFDCWVIRTTAAEIRGGLTWDGGSIANVEGDETEGVLQNRIRSTHVVDGLTPGQIWTCSPVIYSSATDTQIFVDPVNGFGAHMTMQPL